MLQLNALIEQHSPQIIEQQLIKQYMAFAEKNGVSQQTAHQSLVWVLKLMRFHSGSHPGDLNQHDVETYLSALAIEQHVSCATQQLALSAITAFYREFINIDLKLTHFTKSKSRRGFSDRFSVSACNMIIENLTGPSQLMAKLAYYCQLKLNQIANLKISDVDLKAGTISIFDNNNALKFKAVIPLTLQLDLRIQKMRSCQLNNQLSRNSQPLAIKNKPAQIRMFEEKNSLLFILSDIKQQSHLTTPIEITPESQLAILKSEIRIILHQINLTKTLRKDLKLNKRTISIKKQAQKPQQVISRRLAKLESCPDSFKFFKSSELEKEHSNIKGPVKSINSRQRLQRDFFDLGAA